MIEIVFHDCWFVNSTIGFFFSRCDSPHGYKDHQLY